MESHMDRVVVKTRTDARRTTKTPRFDATRRDGTLRAVCCVARLAKGMSIRCTSRLASRPAKSPSRPCAIPSEAP